MRREMNKDKALKLALEALDAIGIEFVCQSTHHSKKDQHSGLNSCPNQTRHSKAIAAIKESLAHPEPRPWVGLTHDEATEIWERIDDRDSWEQIMQVQARLKEKNT